MARLRVPKTVDADAARARRCAAAGDRRSLAQRAVAARGRRHRPPRRARARDGRDRAGRLADDRLRELASELDDLATGERSSMELSRRLSADQLGIALNPPTGGLLMKREGTGPLTAAEKVTLGGLTIFLLGPSQDDIDKLRITWQKWINDNRIALDKLQAEMLADEERLGTLSPRIVANPMLDQALGEGLSNRHRGQPGFADASGRGRRGVGAAHRRRRLEQRFSPGLDAAWEARRERADSRQHPEGPASRRARQCPGRLREARDRRPLRVLRER